MKNLRVAGACLNQTPLDFAGNNTRILSVISEAKEAGVQLLCLPELAISGYGCEDTFFSEYVSQESLESLASIIPATRGITVSVGLPMEFERSMYNVVALLHDGELVGLVPKQELAGDGIYYEPRWFKPWKTDLVDSYSWRGEEYLFGDLIFEIDGIRIGFEICEDAWNGIRPATRHYVNNVDIILNPSASNFAFGKSKVREMLVREASRAFQCTYVYSNLLGNESGRIIYDGEILVAQAGDLLARNRRFSFKDHQVLPVVVEIDKPRIQRKKSFNFEMEIPDNLVLVEGAYETVMPEKSPGVHPEMESKEEEFYFAETLALFDYMRKSYSRGFVLSLSGGADSSACAVLCAHALLRADRELGREGLLERLSYLGLTESDNIIEKTLTCVYQATRNSGDETLESARELAKDLGATFHNWNVESLHSEYISLAESAIGRKLTWETDDLALQNIQARLRSPGIWMLANIHKALLITTSNRSEAAVGYATMDGDTSGGLAPLGGMDKDSLLEWLKWAESALDVSGLQYVNSLQPTAELRPADRTQTDEGDLMPYGILDDIEKAAIRDYKSPLEVFQTLKGAYPDLVLKGYIRRFFTLWARNQWKRERYAPSFHLDDANLDPKTWCRFPILNGGYARALAEMDAWEG